MQDFHDKGSCFMTHFHRTRIALHVSISSRPKKIETIGVFPYSFNDNSTLFLNIITLVVIYIISFALTIRKERHLKSALVEQPDPENTEPEKF